MKWGNFTMTEYDVLKAGEEGRLVTNCSEMNLSSCSHHIWNKISNIGFDLPIDDVRTLLKNY